MYSTATVVVTVTLVIVTVLPKGNTEITAAVKTLRKYAESLTMTVTGFRVVQSSLSACRLRYQRTKNPTKKSVSHPESLTTAGAWALSTTVWDTCTCTRGNTVDGVADPANVRPDSRETVPVAACILDNGLTKCFRSISSVFFVPSLSFGAFGTTSRRRSICVVI